MQIEPIAFFRSPLKEKFGTPRQAGIAPGLPGTVEFCKGFEPAMLDGLEGFDYLWIIWGFSLNNPNAASSAKVRPPRLGGNEKMGVYATRSPYRPNPLGLSSVRIHAVDAAAGRIEVLGADLVDGTPIFDIKPYLEYADAHTGIRSGFAAEAPGGKLRVVFEDMPFAVSEPLRRQLCEILSQDPRPAYHDDPERIYGLNFDGRNVRFKVEGDTLIVLEIS
ncbi:MAG: tRNA (N6-threonylcarbamoyladenosine(37)-N6)-methyltransferase TrmO [Bacteroidales bacterium]|nr:tRNA (N6-threonylcarbamoyladenosine(37)-N6)-methyltransferase TrmO [Bacteroidales bacterium]